MDIQIHYEVEEKLDEKIIELLQSSGLPTSDLGREDSNIAFITAWTNNSEDHLGVIALEPFEEAGILRSLAVRQNYQKKGVGKRLVNRLEEYANGEGVSDLYLLTETAKAFFERLNYSVIPRKKTPESIQRSAQFSQLCPSTAICMYKILSS